MSATVNLLNRTLSPACTKHSCKSASHRRTFHVCSCCYIRRRRLSAILLFDSLIDSNSAKTETTGLSCQGGGAAAGGGFMHLVHKMHNCLSDDSGKTPCRKITCGETRRAEFFSAACIQA